MSLRSEIVDGMADNLWEEARSMHVEEHSCSRSGGTASMSIPDKAYEFAEKWAKDVEQANGKNLGEIYEEALETNEREREGGGENDVRSSPTAFGVDLVHMMTGAGVSWFDSNAEFDLKVPNHESGGEILDLMYLVGSRCKAAWDNPPCPECGAFSREGAPKCSNCGESREEPEED